MSVDGCLIIIKIFIKEGIQNIYELLQISHTFKKVCIHIRVNLKHKKTGKCTLLPYLLFIPLMIRGKRQKSGNLSTPTEQQAKQIVHDISSHPKTPLERLALRFLISGFFSCHFCHFELCFWNFWHDILIGVRHYFPVWPCIVDAMSVRCRALAASPDICTELTVPHPVVWVRNTM